MGHIRHIAGKPQMVDGIGDIYPLKMELYDDFIEWVDILLINMDSFSKDFIELIKINYEIENLKLLDVLYVYYKETNSLNKYISSFEKIFSFVCKQKIEYVEKFNAFFIIKSLSKDENEENSETLVIDRENYDEVRKLILKQNLIFEPIKYENEITQQWVNYALEARARNAPKIDAEAIITTISAINGMDLNLLLGYSIYQVKSLFQRVIKLKNYDATVLFKTVDGNISIENFYEEIDMFKNPYKDVFKDPSKNQHIEDSISGRLNP